jgi:hypothetical protein
MEEFEHLRMLIDERTHRLDSNVQALRSLLDERYATQTKALDAAFAAAERAVTTALDSAEKAVNKAEVAAERRFESVNEFRAQLADQAGSFITRAEYDAKHEALGKQVDDLVRVMERGAGRARGVSAVTATLMTAGGLVVAIIVAVVTIIASR